MLTGCVFVVPVTCWSMAVLGWRLVYRVCMRTLPEIPTGEWVHGLYREIGVQSVCEDVARDTNRWVSAWVVQRDWCTECVWGRCQIYQQVSECMGCTERLLYRVCMRTLPEIPTGEWVSAWVVQRDWYTECVWGRCPRYQQVSVLYREIGIQSVYEDIAQDTNRWVHCPERLVYSVCEDISYY